MKNNKSKYLSFDSGKYLDKSIAKSNNQETKRNNGINKFMSLTRLSRDLPSQTESTFDSTYLKSISNRNEYSYEQKKHNSIRTNFFKKEKKKVDDIENNENIFRSNIRMPTQRKKQYIMSSVLTEEEFKKEEKNIVKESKKKKRNKDHLKIKSIKDILDDEKRKREEAEKQTKIEFFGALENEKANFLKYANETNKKLKEDIMKTVSATLNENNHLTKQIKQLYLNDYIKYCQDQMKHKKPELPEVIEKEKLDEIERTQKINEIRIKNEKKRKLRKKILVIILTLAAHLYRSKLSLSEFLELHEYSLENLSFFKEDFNILKGAIKDDNEVLVKLLLSSNKYLCQMFDDFNETALHIAAKRPRGDIIRLLLSFGAKIDAQDFTGRTALHYACIYNNLENTEILLYEYASPIKKDHFGKQPGDYTTDRLIKFFTDRAKNLVDINLSNVNVKASLKKIRSGLDFFFSIPEERLRRMI